MYTKGKKGAKTGEIHKCESCSKYFKNGKCLKQHVFNKHTTDVVMPSKALKRINSTSVSASAECLDYADNTEEIDGGREKGHRPYTSVKKSRVENRNHITTEESHLDETHLSNFSNNTVTNALNNNGAAEVNKHVILTDISAMQIPSQTANVLNLGNCSETKATRTPILRKNSMR